MIARIGTTIGAAAFVGLFATATPAAAERCDLEAMRWLAGRWSGTQGGSTSIEIWSPPVGGVMLGLHHDRRPDGGTFREALRIEQRDDACIYVARPQGAAATEFRATVHTSREWVFENPQHDWPRQIAYRLADDGTLEVSASGPGRDGADRTLRWVWSRGVDDPESPQGADPAGSRP